MFKHIFTDHFYFGSYVTGAIISGLLAFMYPWLALSAVFYTVAAVIFWNKVKNKPNDTEDAKRYRFLVDQLGETWMPCWLERHLGCGYVADYKPSIDATIDKARASVQPLAPEIHSERVSAAPPACAYPFCETPECCGKPPR